MRRNANGKTIDEMDNNPGDACQTNIGLLTFIQADATEVGLLNL